MQYLKRHCDVISLETALQMLECDAAIPSGSKPLVVITIDDGYRDNYLNAFPVLKDLNLPATICLATDFIGTGKKMKRYEPLPSVDMLSWEEIKMMSEHQITFAAHTKSHAHLIQCTYEEQKREIESSRKAILEHWNHPIVHSVFCYPYGEFNEDTIQILRDLGFKFALTTNSGINDQAVDPLQLKRIEISGEDSLEEFIKKLSNFMN